MSRGRDGLAAGMVRFMARRFGVDVTVVDSLDGDGLVVLRADGADLEPEQVRALRLYSRGYRVFGGPS